MGGKMKSESSKIINIVSYEFENGCHMCVCNLFQIINLNLLVCTIVRVY